MAEVKESASPRAGPTWTRSPITGRDMVPSAGGGGVGEGLTRAVPHLCTPFVFYTPALGSLLNAPGPARPLGLRPALAHCRERRFLPSPACDVQPRPEAVFPAKSLPGFSVASGGRAPMPSLLYGHRQNPSFSRAGFHFRGDGSLSHFHVLHRFGANDGTDWRMNNIRNKTASLS